MKAGKTLKAIKYLVRNHWQKWTILVILGIVVYVGILFYLYVYKPIYRPKFSTFEKLEIKQNIYEKIMNYHSNQEQIIKEITAKNYLDIFR